MAGPLIGKAGDALRTIGELSAETGVATHVLRYWERQVSALKPLRRAGGRRYYRAEDVAFIRQLNQLISEGYTLEGAARAVRARMDAGAGAGAAEATAPSAAPSMSASGAARADVSPADAARPAVAPLLAIRDRLRRALEA